ncbi:MAG: hypothetical protein HY075_07965 [Deltaproteobacteria bacterium]|nr:hypothetical protein [Deltaproteobacteria bacterium]
MPRARSSSFAEARAALSTALHDPWLLANLVLRLALAVFVLSRPERWIGGDSHDYLMYARRALHGEWGGHMSRPPLYTWFLSALAPGLTEPETAAQVALPLVAQTLLVWLGGVALRARASRKVAIAWAYEPALLVYSNVIMSDALCATVTLFTGLFAWQVLGEQARTLPGRSKAFFFGMALGLVTLARSVAMIMGGFSALVLAWCWRGRRGALVSLALLVLGAGVVLAPRVYWNGTAYGRWTVATQGDNWMGEVAGIVENEGSGLDSIHAQKKWFAEHYGFRPIDPYKTLLAHWPTWAWLSAKGVARVLVGHVNVEWAHLLTGVVPLGPAWFKAPEARAGTQVSGAGLVAWVLGWLATLAFCVWVYASALRAAWKAGGLDQYSVWLAACAAVLVGIPQVQGDARFRCAAWPLILLFWGWNERRARIRVRGR